MLWDRGTTQIHHFIAEILLNTGGALVPFAPTFSHHWCKKISCVNITVGRRWLSFWLLRRWRYYPNWDPHTSLSPPRSPSFHPPGWPSSGHTQSWCILCEPDCCHAWAESDATISSPGGLLVQSRRQSLSKCHLPMAGSQKNYENLRHAQLLLFPLFPLSIPIQLACLCFIVVHLVYCYLMQHDPTEDLDLSSHACRNIDISFAVVSEQGPSEFSESVLLCVYGGKVKDTISRTSCKTTL